MKSRVALVLALLLGLLGPACVDRGTEHRVRANAYFRGGDYPAALKECDDGLSAKPDDVATLILRAKVLFEMQRLDDAKQDFDRAVELGAGRGKTYVGDAYLGLAIIASRRKDWPVARAEFDKLLALDPSDVGTRTNLARVELELGDLPAAETNADFAAHARPQDEATEFILGKVLLAEGKLDDASAAFDRIHDANANAPSAPYGLAMVAAKRGDKDAALQRLREAVALKVPNPGDIATDPAFASLKEDPAFLRIADGASHAPPGGGIHPDDPSK